MIHMLTKVYRNTASRQTVSRHTVSRHTASRQRASRQTASSDKIRHSASHTVLWTKDNEMSFYSFIHQFIRFIRIAIKHF